MTKKTRNTLWLNVNGEINTLRRHMIKAGYRAGYETTIAKQQKCKPSEIPLEVIGFYLGGKPEVVEMPDNWQQIMYGSKVGAQKNRRQEKPLAERPAKERSVSDKVAEFLTMRLSQNPCQNSWYY